VQSRRRERALILHVPNDIQYHLGDGSPLDRVTGLAAEGESLHA
jgi:hypothetical protein